MLEQNERNNHASKIIVYCATREEKVYFASEMHFITCYSRKIFFFCCIWFISFWVSKKFYSNTYYYLLYWVISIQKTAKSNWLNKLIHWMNLVKCIDFDIILNNIHIRILFHKNAKKRNRERMSCWLSLKSRTKQCMQVCFIEFQFWQRCLLRSVHYITFTAHPVIHILHDLPKRYCSV